MNLRSTLALLLLASGTALAQPPGAKLPPPAPDAPPLGATEEFDQFTKDIDAMIVQGGLTSDQAAQMAPKVSPEVQRNVAEIEVAIASAEAAELARVPQISAKAAATKLSDVGTVMLGVPGGPSFTIPFINHNYTVQGQINVNLSDYLLRYPALVKAARLGEQVAKVSKRSQELDVGQEARDAYYEWVRAKLQVLIARRQLTQVQATLKQVRALAEVQRLSRADLMRVESQEADAERSLIVLEHLSELREEQLRLQIGAPEGQPLEVGEDIRTEIAVPPGATLDVEVTSAKHKRLDFQVLNLGIEAKEKQRQAEDAGKYPRLSAFAQAEYTDPNQRIFPQNDEFRFTWSAGAQLTWALNDTLIARTTDRRLRGETNELRADRENLSRGARVQIMAAQQAVAAAEASLDATKKGLAAAEEAFRVRRELLNAERATAVELVDAQTDLTRARIAALNARVDLRVALSQLDHALGNDVK